MCFCSGLFFLSACSKDVVEDDFVWKSINVRASAYNSLAYQTSSQPQIAAWGDSLKPGMKCIAVSKDLIKMGIKHNTEVKLEGQKGVFMVKDKMHSRWKKRIDIYMGTDVKEARHWGIRRLKIWYKVPKDSVSKMELTP
ncbi:3D domain-containing protein [Flavobacteriaceae bacterium F08102]|nr:3D domain-containing protein [Flavobacteriaceae bacterium F08102]